jgi:1,4-alpha-glucan branching enzyme
MHRGAQSLVRDLNRLYRDTPALYEKDCESQGFEWVDASDTENSVLSYLRRGSDADRPCLTVCNFTPMPRHQYRVGVPCGGAWRERLNSDAAEYGGSGIGNGGGVEAEAVTWHGRPYSLLLTLPPLATVVLEPAR